VRAAQAASVRLPDERLSNDHTISVEGQRRRAVQVVAEVKRFADPSAESLIVRAGENAISGEILGVGHATSLETRAARTGAGPRQRHDGQSQSRWAPSGQITWTGCCVRVRR
jgi:hypothetical protein